MKLIFFSLIFISSLQAQDTLYIASAFNTPLSNSTQSGFLDQIVIEAFHRLGLVVYIT